MLKTTSGEARGIVVSFCMPWEKSNEGWYSVYRMGPRYRWCECLEREGGKGGRLVGIFNGMKAWFGSVGVAI